MKSKYIIALISVLFAANSAFADFVDDEARYYSGEAYFTSSKYIEKTGETGESVEVSSPKEKDVGGTVPPIKAIRQSIQKRNQARIERKNQLAPTNPDESIYNSDKETSDYVSKEPEEDFDENMMPDGFEADDVAVEENKKVKHFWSKDKSEQPVNEEDTENIVLDCDNMDYDTENYCLYATGNVNVLFVKQNTTVKADKITFDRMNNTIKAEGNVHIVKNGQVIDGDYIFVDMNEESALIENPITRNATIEMKAKKGYVYGDKIIQEQGTVNVENSYPIKLRPSSGAPMILSRMMLPKDQTLTEDMEKGKVRVDAKEIIITQKGEHETVAIKRLKVKKDKYTLLKFPAVKIYTNKNHDYAESNIWELGSYSQLGAYVGPGFVFELPKGSVLKAMPILNYNHRIGVGVMGRFSSGTNQTHAAYGTSNSKILVRGYQKLDDHLYLQYAMNDYIDEWFMGRRRPKYGLSLSYKNTYSSNGFLLKNRTSTFKHLLDFGYYQDFEREHHYQKLKSTGIGTTRLRYMAQIEQSLFDYKNEDKQKAVNLSVLAQMSAGLYGTGDVQAVGRIGPSLHTQYKRWMQDIGYFQSVYNEGSPMPVFDSYRYGKGNVYLREYFRINKYLTVSWYGSMNITGDSPSDDRFQENIFWITVGPGDFKFNLGYDIIRQNTFFAFEVMTNAKGTQVNYDKLVIKRDKKPSDEIKESNEAPAPKSDFKNVEKAPVLQYAQVEDIKAVEDVL